jgi:hypothetical protein
MASGRGGCNVERQSRAVLSVKVLGPGFFDHVLCITYPLLVRQVLPNLRTIKPFEFNRSFLRSGTSRLMSFGDNRRVSMWDCAKDWNPG